MTLPFSRDCGNVKSERSVTGHVSKVSLSLFLSLCPFVELSSLLLLSISLAFRGAWCLWTGLKVLAHYFKWLIQCLSSGLVALLNIDPCFNQDTAIKQSIQQRGAGDNSFVILCLDINTGVFLFLVIHQGKQTSLRQLASLIKSQTN